jgi:hypothetical protein
MTKNTPEQASLDFLTTLRSQYEYALIEANTKAGYFREQLAHVNALLLNQLLPSGQVQPLQAQGDSVAPVLALNLQIAALAERSTPLSLTEAQASPAATSNASISKPRPQKRTFIKAISKTEKPKSKRNSLALLPVYQGLQKREAIAKVLNAERNQEVTIDGVVQLLYGNLSAAEHKAERLRMKTALFQGVKQGMWRKATTPSSYFVGSLKGQGRKVTQEKSATKLSKAITTSAPAKSIQLATPKQAKKVSSKSSAKVSNVRAATALGKRNSLALLPEFAGLKKLDAIRLVLEKHPGEVLHQDTIIKLLYGDLSFKDLKEERVRIKTALLTGVKNKRWEKSPIPSSYFLSAETVQSKPKTPIKTVRSRSSAKARRSQK